MTKQEEIEEIEQIIKSTCNSDFTPYQIAETLYNSGYRKAGEVREETAKEIYRRLLGTEHIAELEQKEHCNLLITKWRLEDLNRVFKEYGVEVEE